MNQNNQCTQLVLFTLAFLFIFYMMNNTPVEGYSSVTGFGNTESKGNMDDYYTWRAYGHNVYDQQKLQNYPYNYEPTSHPKRYTYYNPGFYQYGYGNL